MSSVHENAGTDFRRARLFRNGRNQAVRIPRAFELPGEEVIIHREGGRLVLEPVPAEPRLAGVLKRLEPIPDTFGEIDDPPVEPEDVF